MEDHSILKGQPRRIQALHGGGASKWDMKEALLSRAEILVFKRHRLLIGLDTCSCHS